MQAVSKISHTKLVIFFLLLCLAIMVSLMLYRSANMTKRDLQSLENEQSFLFPAPRDISSFALKGTTDFNQKSLLNHWTLMFFGFTHCSSICPTTLTMLEKVYPTLKSSYPNLQIVFVSLDPQRDSLDTITTYTKAFNNEFIGVTGEYPELRKLQAKFGVVAKTDPESGVDYQIIHTSSIFLIDPKGKLAGHFKYGLTPNQFVKVFQDNMALISHRS